ncbi:transposase [Flavobacterium sp. DSP2-3-1]|uniref:transposase n=1 Tax=Flavobacterium sp. DSP2-3-1 TaxID=2804620 RepID=UPI003CE95CB0
MLRTRRTFGKDFKARVVLKALKEKDTIEVLAKKYELRPNQISMWKTDAIRNLFAVFSAEKTVVAKNEIPSEKRNAQIGQLTLKNDFLKKSLG